MASTIIDFDLRSETCGCVCYGTQHTGVGLTAGSLEAELSILLLCTRHCYSNTRLSYCILDFLCKLHVLLYYTLTLATKCVSLMIVSVCSLSAIVNCRTSTTSTTTSVSCKFEGKLASLQQGVHVYSNCFSQFIAARCSYVYF